MEHIMTWLKRIGMRLFSTAEYDMERRIYTAPSGTQTIEIVDLLLDERVAKDLDELEELMQQQRRHEGARRPAATH